MTMTMTTMTKMMVVVGFNVFDWLRSLALVRPVLLSLGC